MLLILKLKYLEHFELKNEHDHFHNQFQQIEFHSVLKYQYILFLNFLLFLSSKLLSYISSEKPNDIKANFYYVFCKYVHPQFKSTLFQSVMKNPPFFKLFRFHPEASLEVFSSNKIHSKFNPNFKMRSV